MQSLENYKDKKLSFKKKMLSVISIIATFFINYGSYFANASNNDTSLEEHLGILQSDIIQYIPMMLTIMVIGYMVSKINDFND